MKYQLINQNVYKDKIKFYIWGSYMGKKEHLEELDKQLELAKKKLKVARNGTISAFVIAIVALLMPLFWFVVILLFIFSIVYYMVYSKRINDINLEKAKLK